jgi:type I restriction enzyme S subunit
MSFPSHSAYKESGVAWIGRVPSHWSVGRLKHVLAEMGSGGTPDTEDETMWADDCEEGVAWVAIGDMSAVETVSTTAKRVTEKALVSRRLRIWPKGTLLFSMYASLGRVAVLDIDAAINQALLALCPNRCSQGFLRHWLSYLQPRLVEAASSNTQDNLNAEKVKGLPVAYPTINEQGLIAAFLDRETAKIDALVEEQKRLIELLKEKRQAVISQAVTKGLDPNIPMKDSGVEWLGRVPKDWQIVPIRELAAPGRDSFIDGDWIEAPFITDDGVRLIQTGNIGVGFYREQGFRFISDATFVEFRCTEVEPKDVLICRLAEPVGRACLAPDLGYRMITSVDVCILKPAPAVSAEFVVYLLSSAQYLGFMEGQCRGGTRDRVSRSFLGSVRVPLPPLQKQRDIVTALDERCSRLDTLTTEAERAIVLLEERRSALIAAAVTGKIDVRGLVLQYEAALA